MLMNSTITVGTTLGKLLDLLKGVTPPAGITVSKTYAGLQNPNGCQRLIIRPDAANSDKVYIGESDVSAINAGAQLTATGLPLDIECGHGFNDIPLGSLYIVGGAAAQKIYVMVQYA